MAVNITGGGGGARIGAPCTVPRGFMARASHSGSCERGCGDHCSRQKFKLSHLISPLRVRYSLYARTAQSLRSSTVPRLTMMCMWGRKFWRTGEAARSCSSIELEAVRVQRLMSDFRPGLTRTQQPFDVGY